MMQLKELIEGLEVQESIHFRDVPVEGIAYDSRKVNANFLFVCITGIHEDGHKFAGEALKRGAAAVICEKPLNEGVKIPQLIVKDTRLALSHTSAVFYQHPSEKMHVVGITGTNGKTSTCILCEAIMKRAGKFSGVIGTINYRWGDRVVPAGRTTPESLDTQGMLGEMYKAGCKYIFMEVSSHALDQKRVRDVEFRTGIFTNLSLDHLDYHGTFERYFEAKRKLFEMLKKDACAIVNVDDPRSQDIIKYSPQNIITYGIETKADVVGSELSSTSEGTSFLVQTCGEKVHMRLKLIGKGNVYNALAAVGFGISQEAVLSEIKAAFENVDRIRGRVEIINWKGDFQVIVDYAHTPQAMEMLLESIREIVPGRVITVFGCGGDRDKSKRPLMGKISAVRSDFSFVTTDNPRSEEPAEIASQIEAGFRELGKGNYKIILDRGEAIRSALTFAQNGDMVIIAGKGHETYQVFKDTVVPFDDCEAARKVLDDL